MEVIGKIFTLKDGFSQLETFLGAGIHKKNLYSNDYWTMDST